MKSRFPTTDLPLSEDETLKLIHELRVGQIELELKKAGSTDVAMPAGIAEGADPLAWRRNGVGSWLLRFDCKEDVERRWPKTPVNEDLRAQL